MPEQIAPNNQDSNIIELLKSFSEITDPDFIQFGRHLREFKAQLRCYKHQVEQPTAF